MTPPRAVPPRWSRSCFEWAARRLGTPELTGDADELFTELAEREGVGRARSWYRRQARSAVRRALFARRSSDETSRPTTPGRSPMSWLDVKLGLRMLVKTPLLTVTGCVAIATAIAINAGFTEFMGDFFGRFETPAAGGRLVALTNQDLESGGRERRVLEDLGRWRAGLEAVERIGAVNEIDVNLVTPDGRSTPVRAAQVSASIFEITGTVPESGRTLQDSDDGPGVEPVVVLGYGVWQDVLGADPDIVGSTVRLGEEVHTVVGVAPEDFTFPTGRAEVWVNFRYDPGAFARRSGPPVIAFGRLAPGRSLGEAQAEIARLGAAAASDHPDSHERLRPTVIPFEEMVGLGSSPLATWALRGARLFFVMLLVAACANVATLVFARNAGRESEIAIRNALGGGRLRIVAQLFAEAMVLALASAAVGLVVADAGLRYGSDLFWEAQYTDPPAWFHAGLSLPTVLYSLVLAVVGAGIVGILPGLRATRGGAARTLQRAGSGSGTLSFGWLPTTVIVVQTAISVAFLPVVLTGSMTDFKDKLVDGSFSTEPYLTARMMADSEIRRVTAAEEAAEGGEPFDTEVFGIGMVRISRTLLERYDEMAANISRRLAAEPGVRRVVVTSRLPGVVGGTSLPGIRIELDGERTPDGGWPVRFTEADLGLFDVVGHTVIDGRALTSADYAEGERVALVNTSFVDELYGGHSPVGRLVRVARPDGDPDRPWTEIVGVIPDDVAGPGGVTPHIYFPRTRPGVYPLKLLVQVDGDAAAFGPRLRALVAEVEPGMLIDEVIPLAEMRRSEILGELFGVAVMLFVALVTMLLSTTGVYALMSFIVAQRTREIGIRTALGADALLVVKGVFRRALVQLGLGVVVGLGIVGLVLRQSVEEGATRDLILSGVGVAAVLTVVGLMGCAVPLVRALRVQPMRALSTE
jgi:putative ABC transport system permease protein